MNKQELIARIDKIFRANTIEVKEIIGQYDQYRMVKRIQDIQELKDDIISLLESEFRVGRIDKKDVFIGTGRLGASYVITEAIEVAKKWGFMYVAWNDGEIIKLNGDRTGIKYSEL